MSVREPYDDTVHELGWRVYAIFGHDVVCFGAMSDCDTDFVRAIFGACVSEDCEFYGCHNENE